MLPPSVGSFFDLEKSDLPNGSLNYRKRLELKAFILWLGSSWLRSSAINFPVMPARVEELGDQFSGDAGQGQAQVMVPECEQYVFRMRAIPNDW